MEAFEESMRDQRAVAQLKLWLRTVGIPFRDESGTLVAKRANGTEVRVEVLLKADKSVPALSTLSDGTPQVSATKMTGRSLKEALTGFSDLQKLLGYKPKLPVDRGPAPDRKLSNGEDFELTSFLHTQFRRAPNPEPHRFKAFETIIKRSVWKFHRNNQSMCKYNMLELEDLTTFAQVWLTTFLGINNITPEQDEDDETQKMFYTHLGQRFHEFRENIARQARSTLPQLDEAHIGQHGTPFEYGNKSTWDTQSERAEDDESLIARRRREWRRGQNFEIDITIGEDERREAAEVQLNKLLSSYDHDRFLEVLREASENHSFSADAQAEAAKRLRAHAKGCVTCRATSLPVEVDEDVSTTDAAGMLE
jgi:hypothetical protein